jgi:hypothetical protein
MHCLDEIILKHYGEVFPLHLHKVVI